MLQQTPRFVTGAPPFEVTLPPEVAVVDVISVTEIVLTVGRSVRVVNVKSSPYAVPILFVAYALT